MSVLEGRILDKVRTDDAPGAERACAVIVQTWLSPRRLIVNFSINPADFTGRELDGMIGAARRVAASMFGLAESGTRRAGIKVWVWGAGQAVAGGVAAAETVIKVSVPIRGERERRHPSRAAGEPATAATSR